MFMTVCGCGASPIECIIICVDVVVAAPFIGSSQSGEVYIYRGSSNGLRNTASQVLQLSLCILNDVFGDARN